MEQTITGDYRVAAVQAQDMQPRPFGLQAVEPPPTDPQIIMQRADEVNTLQRLLTDSRTSAVVLTGSPGAGKTILSALLYYRLQLAQRAGLFTPRYLIWLSIGPHTTVPDILLAMLQSVGASEPDFLLLPPQQQIETVLHALRRPQENALIILDQFESLLYPEVEQEMSARKLVPLFLQMLQEDLGASRILLTSYQSPYEQEGDELRVRSYMVSRLSIPEGVALLMQRGVQGSPEDLSLVWQRCAGHAFALVLFSDLVMLSNISLSYFLYSPEYQGLWQGEVTLNLIVAVCSYLKPMQYVLMRALSLYTEPVPFHGLMMAIAGEHIAMSERDVQLFHSELSTLVSYGLAQPQPVREETLYILQPLLRQYILERYLEGSERLPGGGLAPALGMAAPLSPALMTPEAQRAAIAAGHVQVATYYYYLAREVCPPPQQRNDMREVEPLVQTVRHLCKGWHWQQACDLLFEQRLHEQLVQWGGWYTLIDLYVALMPPRGVLLRRDEGLIASHLAMLYGRIGEYQQCQECYEVALNIQHEVGDAYGLAVTLANQGELYRVTGEESLARANFEDALAVNSNGPRDPYLESNILHNLGLLHQMRGEYRQALDYYAQALKLAQSTQDGPSLALPRGGMQRVPVQTIGVMLTSIGVLLYAQGEVVDALAIFLAALRLRRTAGDPKVGSLEQLLAALEQKLGADAYAQLSEQALAMQKQVLARFMASN